MAKSAKKSTKTTKSNPLYSIYGSRISKSGERLNISILTGKNDNIKWGTISIPIEGGRVKVVKVTDIEVTIKIPRVDIAEEEEEEEEEEDDED